MASDRPTCLKCDRPLDKGAVTALTFSSPAPPVDGHMRGNLAFVLPGTATSPNPVKAVMQGLAGEKEGERFPVTAWRCPRCGLLAVYALPDQEV